MMMDRTREQQQFFSESGFARVRMGDDGKSAAAFDFFGKRRHGLAAIRCRASGLVGGVHYLTHLTAHHKVRVH